MERVLFKHPGTGETVETSDKPEEMSRVMVRGFRQVREDEKPAAAANEERHEEEK